MQYTSSYEINTWLNAAASPWGTGATISSLAHPTRKLVFMEAVVPSKDWMENDDQYWVGFDLASTPHYSHFANRVVDEPNTAKGKSAFADGHVATYFKRDCVVEDEDGNTYGIQPANGLEYYVPGTGMDWDQSNNTAVDDWTRLPDISR